MDPELKAYLDRMAAGIINHMVMHFDARFDALEARMDKLEARMDKLEARMDKLEARMDALEARMDKLEHRVESMHFEFSEKFASLDERFRSLEMRIEHFEVRITDRMDQSDARLAGVEDGLRRLDRRVGTLERTVLGVSTRVDGLSDEMRQRFRVVNERLATI